MITEDYVSFETAKLLKEKGFDEEVKAFYSYDSEFKIYDFQEDDRWDTPNDWGEYYWSVPTLQMAMKWLREIYKLEVRSTYDYDKDSWWGNINPMLEETDETSGIYQKALRFDYQGKSYEEAAEAAIKYCLENLI